MMATGTRSGVRTVACALAFVPLFASTVGVAAAAGTTDIGVEAERDAFRSGETTAVDVVVADADGGVGALNATVTLSNPDTASVESATIHGDPGLERVTERADGVKLSAALADTDDVGSVTVATIVLRAAEAGRTSVDVNVRALGDEDGVAYSLGTVDRPTITVNGGSESPSNDRTASGPTDAGVPSGPTDAGAPPGPADAGAASGSTTWAANDGGRDGDTGTDDDRSDDNDWSRSAGSLSADRVVDAVRSLLSMLTSPVGAIGAVVVVVGLFVLRRFR